MTTRWLGVALAVAMAMAMAMAAVDAEADEKEQSAVAAATSWLALVDEGRYGESWEQAAGLFRTAVPKDQWQRQLAAVRRPFGSLESRTVSSAEHVTSLPGAPDGDYVVITFRSSFEHKDEAVETVTPMLEDDGVWRVSGYFIR